MPEPVQFAFISGFFGIGGVERTFLTLAEQLKEKGYDFHFINPSSNNFQTRFHACGHCFHSRDHNDIITYLQEHKIDIVQTCNCEEGHILAHLAGVPRIIERPDGRCTAFLTDKTFVDCIICSTDSVFEKAQADYPHKYSKLIYNGVDTRRFAPCRDRSTIRKTAGISSDDIVIGHSGRIAAEKCLEKLIDVFAEVAQQEKNTKLVMVGSDHRPESGYKTMLEEKVASLQLTDRVIFMNPIENPEQILPLFDIAVLSSGSHTHPLVGYVTEGIPNAIMEAMSMGLPVLCTDSGETRLLVQDNVNGYIVGVDDWRAFHDRLLFLIKHRDAREQMGKNSRKIVEEKFNVTDMISRYEHVYTYISSPEFQKSYPVSRKGKENYFFTQNFTWSETPLEGKKILFIRSGNNDISSHIVQDLHRHFKNPEIIALCHKHNYSDVIKYSGLYKTITYDKSDRFEPGKMADIIETLNEKQFDFLVFVFNDLWGKNYSNVKELVNEIQADTKIVVNRLHKKYRWIDQTLYRNS